MAHDDAVATAWRLHASLADWTGRIDAKASFALTIESAVLAGVGASAGTDHGLGGISGWWAQGAIGAGAALLVLAAFAAVSVVLPRQGRGRSARRGSTNTSSTGTYAAGHRRTWPTAWSRPTRCRPCQP
jgi:hypothetical protein